MSYRVTLGKLRFLYQDKRWSEACKSVHRLMDKFVAKAINKTSQEGKIPKPASMHREHYILLNEMARVTQDTDDLRYQILNVFLAGHESTAVALGSIFFHLARNRAAWDKLRSEVKAIGDAPLTFELLKNIPYLRYVISESKKTALLIGGKTNELIASRSLSQPGSSVDEPPMFQRHSPPCRRRSKWQ